VRERVVVLMLTLIAGNVLSLNQASEQPASLDNVRPSPPAPPPPRLRARPSTDVRALTHD
jgi:hypothetical protein